MSRARTARPTGIEADFAAFLRMVEAEKATDIPASFVEFVDVFLTTAIDGKKLSPGQRVIARVMYDRVDPAALVGEERELARRIFGDVDTVPPDARTVAVVVAGGRGGKSFALCALRLLHLALTVPLKRIAPGEVAVGAIIGPTMQYAGGVLGYITGAIHGHPALAALLVSESKEEIVIKRADGRLVAFRCLAAGAKGGAGRGKSLVGAVLDEAAMFRDPETGKVNDEELYRAVAPRVVSGGQVIIASTPWTEAGLLYSLWRDNFGKPEHAIVAHAPTLVMLDDEENRRAVTLEELRDPANARREFGAEFMSKDADAFFDNRALKAAVVGSLPLPGPIPAQVEDEDDEDEWGAPPPTCVYAFGADFGFQRDASALVGVRRDPGDVYTVVYIEERVPTDQPLVVSTTVGDFAAIAKPYGAKTIAADQHYRQAIVEWLDKSGLGLVDAPGGASGIADMHVLVRTLFHGGQIRLPNHERLLRQLRETTAKPLAGGGLSIANPRWKSGGHGDIARALVTAIWHASKAEKPEAYTPPPPPGSYEWHAADVAARKQKLIERVRRRKDPDDDDWILGE